jgi:hypothetical protein
MAIGASASYSSMESLGNGVYSALVPAQADGPITLRVRAVGAGGAVYGDVVHMLTVDNTPPVIDQLSVADGGSYPVGQTISFRVSDAHLQSVLSTLDGQPFSPGQRVSTPGRHELHIAARDQAGNEAQQTIVFTASALQEPVPISMWRASEAMLALMCLAMMLVAQHTSRRNRKK